MGKKECKQVLEDIYKVPFRKSSINNFSIDFYNSSLTIGIQYNGRHHYEYVPRLHKKSYKNFREMQRRDILRKQMCKEAGIKLISIPYNTSCISKYIRLRLGKELSFCGCESCDWGRRLFRQ